MLTESADCELPTLLGGSSKSSVNPVEGSDGTSCLSLNWLALQHFICSLRDDLRVGDRSLSDTSSVLARIPGLWVDLSRLADTVISVGWALLWATISAEDSLFPGSTFSSVPLSVSRDSSVLSANGVSDVRGLYSLWSGCFGCWPSSLWLINTPQREWGGPFPSLPFSGTFSPIGSPLASRGGVLNGLGATTER